MKKKKIRHAPWNMFKGYVCDRCMPRTKAEKGNAKVIDEKPTAQKKKEEMEDE